MHEQSRVYVAGHTGLVGSALVRALRAQGFRDLVLASHAELDLRDQAAVRAFFEATHPTHVFLAAAKVGGILANDSFPADFLFDNLAIATNVIHAAFEARVQKLLFLGSSCIYPKRSPQPIKEEYLLTGPLEPTNEWYAVAKIAGIKLCQAYRRQHGADFIAAMPTNLYGPGDNFNLETSHVLPALLRKIHEAKVAGAPSVTVWGSGRPRREFLYVDDCAEACVFLMRRYSDERILNVGCGEDISIQELARTIAHVVGYEGEFVYDPTKPDGMLRKLIDSTRIRELGWSPKVSLEEGLRRTYTDWVRNPSR